MASLFAKPCCDTALGEVGYQAEGKWNKYADVLDSVNYFVGCGNKQGLDWCCVFVCYCLYMNTLNAESVLEPNAWSARWFQYQSDTCNMSAVVKYMAQYYKDNGAWVGEKDAGKGDIIFYKKSNGTLYHVGIVVDWGYFDELGTEGFKVVEGNTNGGQVAIKYYPYGDSKIAGFGQPRYDGWEMDNNGSSDDTEPTPEPTPAPEPEGKPYMVCVNTFLNVRTGPSTSYPSIWKLYDGEVVMVFEEKDGWGKVDAYEEQWVCMKYLKAV